MSLVEAIMLILAVLSIGSLMMAFLALVLARRVHDQPDPSVVALREQVAAERELWQRTRSEMSRTTKRVAIIEFLLDEYRRGTLILVQQLREAGLQPIWTPPTALNIDDVVAASDGLFDALRSLFSIDELNVLAFQVGISLESIGGQTLPVIALRLVERARHLGKEKALTAAVLRERPNAVLPMEAGQ